MHTGERIMAVLHGEVGEILTTTMSRPLIRNRT